MAKPKKDIVEDQRYTGYFFYVFNGIDTSKKICEHIKKQIENYNKGKIKYEQKNIPSRNYHVRFVTNLEKIGLLINNTSFSKSHYLVNPEGILKYIDEHFLKINEEEIKKLKNKNILEIYNKHKQNIVKNKFNFYNNEKLLYLLYVYLRRCSERINKKLISLKELLHNFIFGIGMEEFSKLNVFEHYFTDNKLSDYYLLEKKDLQSVTNKYSKLDNDLEWGSLEVFKTECWLYFMQNVSNSYIDSARTFYQELNKVIIFTPLNHSNSLFLMGL